MSDNVNSLADPLYVRAIAERIASGSVALDDPRTIPVDLTAELDRTWLSLPVDHRFLLHRMLGLLALMREPATDDAIASILGFPNVFAEDVADLRRHIAPWLIFKGDGYVLAHERLKAYLTGNIANVSPADIPAAATGGTGKFRLNDLCAFHEALVAFYDVAKASCGNSVAGSMDRMTDSGLRFLVWHLGQIAVLNTLAPETEDNRCPARDRLYALMRNQAYCKASVARFQNYDAVMDDLNIALKVHVVRQGRLPQDDARLCWLALRAGLLGAEARSDIRSAFEWARNGLISDALTRIDVLRTSEFVEAALLIYLVEAERQLSRTEDHRRMNGIEAIVASVRRKVEQDSLKPDFSLWVAAIDRAAALSRDASDNLITLVGCGWTSEGVKRLLERNLWREANATLQYIKSSEDRALALVLMGGKASKDPTCANQQFLEAERLAISIDDNERRVIALAKLAEGFCLVNRPHDAERLLLQAHTLALSIQKEGSRDRALRDTVYALGVAGRHDAARDLTGLIANAYTKLSAIISIAEIMAIKGMYPVATVTFEEAERATEQIGSRVPRAQAYGELVCAMVRSSRFPEAQRVIANARNTGLVSWILVSVVDAFLCAKRYEDALTLVNDESYESTERARALFLVAREYAVDGRMDDACSAFLMGLEIAARAERENKRSGVDAFDQDLDSIPYKTLSVAFASAGLFSQAIVTAKRITSIKARVDAFAHISCAMRLRGRIVQADKVFNQARRLADELLKGLAGDPAHRDVACSLLAQLFAKVAGCDDALRLVSGIKGEWSRNEALSGVAPALAEAGRVDEAMALSESITDAWRRSEAFAGMARVLMGRGKTDVACRLFAEAKRLAMAIGSRYTRTMALRSVSVALIGAGNLAESLQIIEEMEPGLAKARILLRLAQSATMHQQSGMFCRAIDAAHLAADACRNRMERTSWLAMLAATMADAHGEKETLSDFWNLPEAERSKFVETFRGYLQDCRSDVMLLVRRTFLLYPFSIRISEDGVYRLLAALIRDNSSSAVRAIIAECPTLGLNELGARRNDK